MAQGFSLHIGLNGVDASKYNGWAGTLAGCINDANAMQSICSSQGFTTQMLLDGDATADAILGAIGQAAYNLQSGDTCLISYSGHGGQVPDTTGDSPTGLDDTWVAYDRMVLGHELYNLWGQFSANVRIEVYSDSCHSGTVIRELFIPGGLRWPQSHSKAVPMFRSTRGIRNLKAVFSPVAKTAMRAAPPAAAMTVRRSIPPGIALAVFERDMPMYEAAQWTRKRGEITASVILISGCQDNQESADGNGNGLFTEKLLSVWDSANFSGTLPQFHQAILGLMPPEQTPNYFTLGVNDDAFTNSKPLTVVVDERESSGTGPAKPPTAQQRPSVTGPDSYDRANDNGPAFNVKPGANMYYIFEITSDPNCFGYPAARTASNFYGSWDDPRVKSRFTGGSYTLPAYAWAALRGNGALYYRIGTTSSSDLSRWDNYAVSTSDGQAGSAPVMTVNGVKVGTAPPLVPA